MKHWIAVAARLVVGGVWIVAGGLKITSPAASALAVHAYQIPLLDGAVGDNIGYLLPSLELVLGLALVLGVVTRGAAVLSTVLLVVYVAGIASVWARGINIDCGCFGGGGYDPNASSKYPWEIARDVGLALLSAFVVWVGPTRLALDGLLFRRTTTDPALLEDPDHDPDDDLDNDPDDDPDSDHDGVPEPARRDQVT